MEERSHHIVELIGKFRAGIATPSEVEELEAWYATFDSADKYTPGMTDEDRNYLKKRNFYKITQRINQPKVVAYKWTGRKRLHRAAIGLLLLAVATAGTYYAQQSPMPIDTAQPVVADAMPGGNRATLMLGDGTTINLDSVGTGDLAIESGMRITKSADGQVQYNAYGQANMPDAQMAPTEPVYNTITTPAGGQYVIVLPDGTNVWMNAASSLRYPTQFVDDTRTVELEGEAYFDVATMYSKHSPSKKTTFIVKTSSYDVAVVGTEFNVNAYHDELSVNTTLVSGHVDILLRGTDDQTVIERVALLPNQQARMLNGKIEVEEVDVETAIAWKSGFFYFKNANLYTLVRQFSRWYNVEVSYAPGVKNDVFFGRIPRGYTLSEAMKVLELGDVRFQIDHHPERPESGRMQMILKP